MIGILSRALVTFAADRWPAHLREEVRREWLAELAVLSESKEHLKCLRFAVSLAAHPAPRPELTITTRFWYAFRVLMIGPVLCGALLLACYFTARVTTAATGLVLLPTGWTDFWGAADFVMDAQLPTLTALNVLAAFLASRIGQRWSPDAPGFLLPVLIATVPGLAAAAVFFTATSSDGEQRQVVFETYFLGFGAVLYLVARLARAGRRKQAWRLGAVGAFVMLDIAVMPAVLGIRIPSVEGDLDLAYAPLWLVSLLTDTGFGLPHPSPVEVFSITDVLAGVPNVLIIVTGWALGVVMGIQNRASSSSALATAPGSPPSTVM